jgi:hypothetical protein
MGRSSGDEAELGGATLILFTIQTGVTAFNVNSTAEAAIQTLADIVMSLSR